MEHRYGHRYSTEAIVHVSSRTGVLLSTGILRNVSFSGGFIHTPLPAPVLSRAVIHFLAPYATLPRIEGQVVRVTATGLAIEWLEFMPELVHILARPARLLPSAQSARQLEPN
jgi:hypothetical protein